MSLMELDPAETRRAIEAAKGVLRMLEQSPPQSKLEEYNAALELLKDAVVATRRYQSKALEGKSRDAETEDQLSTLWFQAGHKIGEFDPDLSYLCAVKGWGWADETIWDLPENKDLPIRLEQMVLAHQSAAKSLNEQRNALSEFQKLTQQIATAHDIAAGKIRSNAWVNGSFYLVAMLAIIALLAGVATTIKLVLVPIIIVGGLLAVTTIGAFQLTNDGTLSQENFLSLMRLTFEQLPILRLFFRKPKEKGSDQNSTSSGSRPPGKKA